LLEILVVLGDETPVSPLLTGDEVLGGDDDTGVGDEVVPDAQGVVANSHGSTQPYWQPLLMRQLCRQRV
jgi:hypothetical protein